MVPSLRFLSFGPLLSAAVTAMAKPADGSPKAAKASKYMFVFGDSYSTTNFDIKGAQPRVENPIGNPGFPGVTTAGGPNWVGYIISQGNQSVVLTWDFAVSGATTDKEIVHTSTQNNVDNQVHEFLGLASSIKDRTAENTLAVIWTGINDLGDPYWSSQGLKDRVKPPISKILDRYYQLLRDLADKGGIKNFALIMVPPFTLAPAFKDKTDTAGLKEDIVVFNENLAQRLDGFKKDEGVRALAFDPTHIFVRKVTDAGKDPKSACENKDAKDASCLWTDQYHPTTVLHKKVAAALQDELKKSGIFTF